MPASIAYAQRHKDVFRLDEAPSLSTRCLKKGEISVSECSSDSPDGGLSSSFPEDDAYSIHLMLREYLDCENWEGGRALSRTHARLGTTQLYDIKRDPRFVMDKPFHVLAFYIPRIVFDTIAEEANAKRISELRYTPGVGFDDAVVRSLSGAMLAALAQPEQASRLFVENVTLAVATHVAQTYGGLSQARGVRGGLAGWQQSRACEMMDAQLDGTTPLAEIAAACGLSTGHFARAFRTSMGYPPHTWLLRRRVDAAKALLADKRLALSEIALAAGFSDQSHFTRVFSKIVGVSPGAWRRSMCGGQLNREMSGDAF